MATLKEMYSYKKHLEYMLRTAIDGIKERLDDKYQSLAEELKEFEHVLVVHAHDEEPVFAVYSLENLDTKENSFQMRVVNDEIFYCHKNIDSGIYKIVESWLEKQRTSDV